MIGKVLPFFLIIASLFLVIQFFMHAFSIAHSKKEQRNDITGGFDPEILQKWMSKGMVYAGPPDSAKKYSAAAWKQGMKFVYERKTKRPIPHWYFCEKCKRFINTNVSNGTASIRTHAQSHVNPKYTFRLEDLQEILSQATKFGSRAGGREAKDFKLPTSTEWSLDFLKDLCVPSKYQGIYDPCIAYTDIK